MPKNSNTDDLLEFEKRLIRNKGIWDKIYTFYIVTQSLIIGIGWFLVEAALAVFIGYWICRFVGCIPP